MKSSPKILAQLLRLKELSDQVHGKLHDQEHLWEAMEYKGLEKVFDEANREVWDKMLHRFLKRLYDLGGRPPGVSENIIEVYSEALVDFTQLHEECSKLYELVEEDEDTEGSEDDYVTSRMLMKIQKRIESWINYFEAKLAQAKYQGEKAFMSEQM